MTEIAEFRNLDLKEKPPYNEHRHVYNSNGARAAKRATGELEGIIPLGGDPMHFPDSRGENGK